MTDPARIAYAEARELTLEAALHEHRGALRALLARAFDGGYAAGELATQARIRELEDILRAVRTEADCTSAGPGRDAQRAFPAGREAFFEEALDRIYALAADALADALADA